MPKILPGDKIPDFHLTMAFHPETDLYELLKEKIYGSLVPEISGMHILQL